MQDRPLTLNHLFERAERLNPTKEVVTATATGVDRYTYGEWADRTRRLAAALDSLGISPDGRVATFAWNTGRHLELYFAAPCSGRVLHTLALNTDGVIDAAVPGALPRTPYSRTGDVPATILVLATGLVLLLSGRRKRD